MKRMMTTTATALAVALAGTAMAGVSASRHDMTAAGMNKTGTGLTNRGVCSFCHVPHGAQGDRLWAGAPASGYTTVANLCATCHVTGNNGSITDPAQESDRMFIAGAHGFSEAVFTTNPRVAQGNGLASAALPYTGDGGTIDCTSCHDVHTNTAARRPFLRTALLDLCEKCHTDRITTTFGSANTNGAATPKSTHPVIEAAYVATSTRPIVWTAPYQRTADLTLGSVATGAAWVLGGHRSDGGTTGNVTCVTCHIVHGTDPVNTEALPANDLLVNAKTGASNLCLDCHTTNPGAVGAGYHPVNGDGTYLGQATGNTLEISATWLNGSAETPSASLAGGGGELYCLTCHDTHFGENNTSMLVDTTIAANEWCTGCHTGTIITNRIHHPANPAAGNANRTSYDTATYETYIGATQTTASSMYSQATACQTCHRAHNAVNQNITGQPDAFALRGQNWSATADTPTSNMCVACHTANPAKYKYGLAGDAGIASHYVSHGPAANATSAIVTWGSVVFDALPGIASPVPERTGNWPSTNLQYPGSANLTSYSKYGAQTFVFASGPAATGGMLCESCHSVTNPREDTYLLLGEFNNTARTQTDRGTAVAATPDVNDFNGRDGTTVSGGDGLCLGCHGIPRGTHPTTGSMVSKTGLALAAPSVVDPVNGQMATNPVGATTTVFYPAAGEMTCTSCHDTHSGNTGAGFYILKEGQLGSAMGTVAAAAFGTAMNTSAVGLNFTDLCAGCHNQYR